MIHRIWKDCGEKEDFIECDTQTDTLIRLMTEYREWVTEVTAEGFIVWLQLVKSIRARIVKVGNIYY